MGVQTIGQFHDEVIVLTKVGEEDVTKNKLEDGIRRVNDDLQLNVKLGVDVQFGNTYAEIH